MPGTVQQFEPFDKGLVTAKDPAALAPGELTQADNAVYRPNDLSIYKVRGRTKFDSTTIGAAVKGLRLLEYDDSSNQLLAYSGSMYYKVPMTNSESSGANHFAAALSNVVVAGCSLDAGVDAFVITTTTANGFANVLPTWGVSGGGGNIPANTKIIKVVNSTTIQVDTACTTFSAQSVTVAPTVGSGLTLESIQYNNNHYLLNGVQNYVMTTDGAFRPHGLLPVTEPPTVTNVSGHWNTALGIGYWFFFTVEVLNAGSAFELESTNIVVPNRMPYFQITAANIASTSIQITRPPQVNANATQWRVYGAVNVDSPEPPPLSDFVVMAQQGMENTTALAGDVTVFGAKNPATAAVAAGSWNQASKATGASDNKFAYTNVSGSALTLTNCSFGAYTNAFSGIEVVARLYFPMAVFGGQAADVRMDVNLQYGAGPTTTVVRHVDIACRGIQTITVGSNTDGWGRTAAAWLTTDISNANFGATLTFNKIGSDMATVYLDSIEIRLYTQATSSIIPILGKAFPVTVLSIGGVTSVIGSHGPPPVATTGDIFDDQMCVNDVTDKSIIRFSIPGEVEYYPFLYFVPFETKHTDEVTNIARVGNVNLVGLKNNIYRVNYLPRDTDSEFDRGRCYEPLAEGQGIVGTQAAANLTLPGGEVVRAFASYSGINVTNGFKIETWSDDIDWSALVSTPENASGTDYLQNCILVDYPVVYQLWFFYTPVSGTTNTKALVFHYHPIHIKENGKPKITGPITSIAGAATIGKVSNMPVLLTGGDTGAASGFVFVQDRGYVDNETTGAPNMSGFAARTRELYLAGFGHSYTVNTSYVRHRADTTSTVTVTPRTRVLNNAQAAQTAKTFTTTNGGAAEVPFSLSAESMDFKFSEEAAVGANQIRLLGIALEVVDEGLTEQR